MGPGDRGVPLPRRRRGRGTAGSSYPGWLLKTPVWLVCLGILGGYLAALVGDRLGANPVEALSHASGAWALRLLLLTLAMTPLRRLSGWSWPLRMRRLLGLWAFFYAVLHLSVWIWLDQGLDWRAMAEDLAKRPYVMLGMAAFGLLVPLAVTSTRGWMRRLGRRWKRLHRGVYPAALLAVGHFLWLTKADYLEPGIYAGVLLGLLGLRLIPQGPALGDSGRRFPSH